MEQERENLTDDWDIFSDPELEELLLDDRGVSCKYTVGVTALTKIGDTLEDGKFSVLGIYDDPDVAVEAAEQVSVERSTLLMITDALYGRVTVEETLVHDADLDYVGTVYKSPVLDLTESERF